MDIDEQLAEAQLRPWKPYERIAGVRAVVNTCVRVKLHLLRNDRRVKPSPL